MATLSNNIARAIRDFDNIETAIEDMGVEVPEDTSTSSYPQKIREIDRGITPTGTINITENSNDIDVTQYATADVNVPQGVFPSGNLEITENNTYDVTEYEEVTVAVPQPSGKITITENATDVDVSEYATADIDVKTSTNELSNLIGRTISGTFVIPAPPEPVGVVAVGDYAFYGCIGLTAVEFENVPIGNNEIGYSAFAQCPYLTSLDLRGFRTVRYNAFNASGITSLYFSTEIAEFVNGSGQTVFGGATQLTDIYYTGTQAQWEAIRGLSDAGISADVTIHYEYTPE